MSEFELGVMAGWAAGVATAGAVAGVLDWWRARNRVVTIHTGCQPCAPVAQDGNLGAPIIKGVTTMGKVECCLCKGRGWHQNFDRRKFHGKLPPPVQCGLCKGTGWMTPPPKKP